MVGAAGDGEIGRAEIGLTGARFGGSSRRRRSRPDPVAEPPAPAPEPPDRVGLTGARFGGASRRRRFAETPPRVESPPVESPPVEAPPVAAPVAAPPPVRPPRAEEPPAPPEVSPYATVRPYVLTGGRTRAGVEFAVEALVTAAGPPRAEPVEHTRIRALCSRPRSVAEVAALTGVPLGVARVLLGDMLAAGSVSVHRTADAGGPDLALLERVLSGLRRL